MVDGKARWLADPKNDSVKRNGGLERIQLVGLQSQPNHTNALKARDTKMTTTMRAVVLEAPWPPEALQLRDIPVPTPIDGQVLIEVKAFGLYRSELHTRLGPGEGVTFHGCSGRLSRGRSPRPGWASWVRTGGRRAWNATTASSASTTQWPEPSKWTANRSTSMADAAVQMDGRTSNHGVGEFKGQVATQGVMS